MKLTLLLVAALAFSACANNRPHQPPAFQAGELAIAQNFANYPQYNGTVVKVSGDLRWRWIKELHGNALRVYEVTTVDGQKLAAQEFQLRRP